MEKSRGEIQMANVDIPSESVKSACVRLWAVLPIANWKHYTEPKKIYINKNILYRSGDRKFSTDFSPLNFILRKHKIIKITIPLQ